MEKTELCEYPADDPVFKSYHDVEWGYPVSDDTKIFEKICLEGFQSGLSWKTILHRREGFRQAFRQFNIESVSNFTEPEVSSLLENSNIIRNRRKILSTINNANRALELQDEFGSLARFLWLHEPDSDQRPTYVTREWLVNNTITPASITISRELKERGWTFVGPTNMYALMQALGLVNDHAKDCPCRSMVELARQRFHRPS